LAAPEDEIPHDKDPEHSRRENDPLQHIQHKELPAIRFVHFVRRRWCSVRFGMALLKSKEAETSVSPLPAT